MVAGSITNSNVPALPRNEPGTSHRKAPVAVGHAPHDATEGPFDGGRKITPRATPNVVRRCLTYACYTVWAVRSSRREQSTVQQEYADEFGNGAPSTAGRVAFQVVLVIVGLALLMLGARLFLNSAVEIARGLGVSELVIGLTLVAAGTSLPEVATSVLAAIRGERDIAVGNVVGSNLFNIMGVLGVSGLVAGKGVSVSEAALMFDVPVMIGVAIACLPVFFTGHLIARWEGAMFLAYYVAYTAFLVLSAADSAWTETLEQAMLWFVLPLTAVTLAIGVARGVRRKSGAEGSSPKTAD